jgi:2-C-methyl-D-erythritol 4-phosphate cytidylyltransferase
MKIIAIIPAGGKGIRSGLTTPKQYLKFNGKELIVYTLEVFQKNKLIDELIVAVSPFYFSLLQNLKKKYKLSKLTNIVEGGKERQNSVFNALNSLNANKNDLIVVHDAARPLLPQNVLTEAINTAKMKGNALVCLKVKDTLINGNKTVRNYLDRKEIYNVQTPQIFRYFDLMNAMNLAFKSKFYGTDESILVKRLGKKIHIVEGSPLNFKITTKEDLQILPKLLK